MVYCPHCNGNGDSCDMCCGTGVLPMLTDHESDKLIRDIKRVTRRMSPPPPPKKKCPHCGKEI